MNNYFVNVNTIFTYLTYFYWNKPIWLFLEVNMHTFIALFYLLTDNTFVFTAQLNFKNVTKWF